MSEGKKSEVLRRACQKIKQLRERNVVKSIVLEYENVLSQVETDVTTMGANQSVPQPITNNTNSLVKQRIEKFNQIGNELKKTTRSVSTNSNTIKHNKDFLRSKSEDSMKNKNKNSVKITINSSKSITKSEKQPRKTLSKSKTDTAVKQPIKKNSGKKVKSNLNARTECNLEIIAHKNASIEPQSVETEAIPITNENAILYIEDTKIKDDMYSEINNIDEEFDKIESQLQNATKDIFEMTETKPVFTSSVYNFFITNDRRDTKLNKDNQTDTYCDLNDIENVDIYMFERSSFSNDCENEFGEISKNDLKNVDFVEAYNQAGHELIVTTIHSVTEAFIEDENLFSEKKTDLNRIEFMHDQEKKPEEQICNGDHNSLNGVDNKLYFSKEELETLLPDDDNELNKHVTTKSTDDSISESISQGDLQENIEETPEISVQNAYFDSIKSETTIYDSFQNPRIAKVRSITKREEFPKDSFLKDDDDVTKHLEYKSKIEYIIEELIETEKKYIDHLESILEDYMPYFKSNNLVPKNVIRTLFGNIKEIYQTTQKLYRTLKGCSNYEGIAKTFLRYNKLFELYPLYFKNKPIADQYLLGEFKEIIAIRERELNDQLGLASHLLTPIQRLGKYILFLGQINKELNKNGINSEYVVMALNMVKKEMTTGNDYVAVDSIKKCPIGLVHQGSFLMRGKFKVLKPKKYEAVVFFFEKIIVFTAAHPKNSELFIYKDSIKLDEMGIVTYDDEPLIIHLKRFPSGNGKEPDEQNRYVIEAKREKDKKMWCDEIEKRLWDQLIRCRERQMLLNNCARKTHLFEDTADQTRKKKAGHRSLPRDLEKDKRKSTFYLNY